MGSSKARDLIRVLGKPTETVIGTGENAVDEGRSIYYYDSAQGFAGTTRVYADTKTEIISMIEINPKNMSRSEAISYFGTDYVITRYDMDSCFEELEAAPIYESKNGDLEFMEYRDRGIAIKIRPREGDIQDIAYLSEANGNESSKCPEQK